MKCPICGREKSPSLPFIEGICIECYLKKNPLKPIKLEIKRCRQCGAVFLRGKWEPFNQQKLVEYMSKEAERELRKRFRAYGFEIAVTEFEGRFTAHLFGKEGSFSFPIDVLLEEERSICPNCLAKRSGYYEAKIQVRGEGKIDRKTFEEVMEVISSLPYELREAIVSIDELREGFDINIRDKAEAKLIASAVVNKLGGTTKLTYKLISERGGEKRTRLSISVRLPHFKNGELIEFEGEPALVIKKKGEDARILILSRRKEIRLSRIEMEALKPFTGTAKSVTVEAVLPEKVIVMDEEYSTEEVPASNVFGEPVEKKSFVLIEHREKRYLVDEGLVQLTNRS